MRAVFSAFNLEPKAMAQLALNHHLKTPLQVRASLAELVGQELEHFLPCGPTFTHYLTDTLYPSGFAVLVRLGRGLQHGRGSDLNDLYVTSTPVGDCLGKRIAMGSLNMVAEKKRSLGHLGAAHRDNDSGALHRIYILETLAKRSTSADTLGRRLGIDKDAVLSHLHQLTALGYVTLEGEVARFTRDERFLLDYNQFVQRALQDARSNLSNSPFTTAPELLKLRCSEALRVYHSFRESARSPDRVTGEETLLATIRDYVQQKGSSPTVCEVISQMPGRDKTHHQHLRDLAAAGKVRLDGRGVRAYCTLITT